MSVTRQRWTVEEVRAMQDESRPWPRYELVGGALLVTPAPSLRHQRAVQQLVALLAPYVAQHALGEVLTSPADIELAPGEIVQPDVFVVPLVDGRRPREWSEVRSLVLAAEVLSPGNARQDRIDKRHYYQRHEVPEYWIVDPDAQLFERWRPGDDRPEVLDEWLEWRPAGASEALRINVRQYFARLE